MNNIDILEEFINNYEKVQKKYKDDEIQAEIERSCYFEEVPYQAISNLISENKELKKEKDRVGKLYYEANENCIKYEKDYIPKSEVEEKIKELEAMSISQEIYYEDVLTLLQSLLGKE